MIRNARTIVALCLLGASAAASAADAKQARCVKQEKHKGHGAPTSSAICTVKGMFQSRIRRKTDEEPVEMTVGSPPMISDDTDTPGPDNWEISAVVDAEISSGHKAFEAPLMDINYGIGERLQLKYEVPYVIVRDSPAGGPSQTDQGIGDSVAGIKYRFYDDDQTGLSLALYPQLRFHTPGAADAVAEGGTSVILPLVLVQEFAAASLTANLGVEKASQAAHADYFTSIGAGTRITPKIALMAELAAQGLRDAPERTVIFNVGLKLKVSGTRSLLAKVGHDLRSPDGEPSQAYATVAYQCVFGE